jgi:hypothetical protein
MMLLTTRTRYLRPVADCPTGVGPAMADWRGSLSADWLGQPGINARVSFTSTCLDDDTF